MPSVAFKALEPEGGTLPSRLDYDAYYDDSYNTDDDVYYDDDDDVHSNGDDSDSENVYLEEPEEEFEIPLESSSLRRNGSTHIRDLAQPALSRYGTLGSMHIDDLAQPAGLSRYGTLSSVHIEDIMPTPTDYMDRCESAHIEDLTRMQGHHIYDPAPRDYRHERDTHATHTSRSRSSSKSGSKSSSRSRSKSKSRKPKSGRNEKESKESKPKSRSRSKSNSSRQRQRSRSRSKKKTKEIKDHQASKALRKSKKKSKSSSSSTKSSLHTILKPKKSSSSKQQKLYLSPLEVHNSIANATKTTKSPKSRSKTKSPPQPDQLYPSIATTTSGIEEPIVDDSNSSFLREQRELLEKIAQNDAKLEALKEQNHKTAPPRQQQQQRASKPKKHPSQPQPKHRRHPQPPMFVDESILETMEPHEREFFLQEQQQLLEKIKKDRAVREADARFAQELAALQEQQHDQPERSRFSSSVAKQNDEGTASTCSPGSSLESSSSPSWAATVVNPPVLDVVHCNPNPSYRRRAY